RSCACASRATAHRSSRKRRFMSLCLAAIVERRRLDAERAEIDVALSAVMDLVVDRVENHPDAGAFPLAKRGIDFLKSVWRNGLPHTIELGRRFVPQLQD